ncbi:unnamed protein product [Rhizopus stolonifer]
MEKSFGSLLRSSRLASFDKTIDQVYKTPKNSKRIGNWGLKRNLPTVIRTPHVVVKALDTAEHQTPWNSGESKVMFVKRWKENFPSSNKPTRQSEEIQHNIASMTPAEFQQFLKTIEKRAPEFKAAIARKELLPEQVFDYLKVNVTGDSYKGGGVVGPTYSDHQVEWDYPVPGRILNILRRTEGHAVGIGGVVAQLPRRFVLGLKASADRMVRTFYVQHSEIDEEGKPRVTVTIRRKTSPTTVSILNGGDTPEYQSYYDRRTNPSNMTANDMWNTQSQNNRRHTKPNQMEENIEPNPEHADLMSRISSLLDSQKK